MTIAFDAAGGFNSNAGTDVSTSAGKFGIVGFVDDDNPINPITMPSGWTQQLNDYQGGDGGNAAICTIPSTLGGAAALAFQNSGFANFVMCTYTGLDTVTPIHRSAETNATHTGTGALWTVTAPSVTTTIDGCQILIYIMTDTDSVNGSVSAAVATGFTSRAISNGSTPWNSAIVLDANQATHGATGTTSIALTMTGTPTGGWIVWTLALAPPGAGLVPYVDIPVRRVYSLPARIPPPADVIGRLSVKPWTQDALIVVPSRSRKATIAPDALPVRVLGPLPTWATEYTAPRTQPAQRRIAQDIPFKGATSNALGPIVDVPAMRAQPAATRAALDQVIVTTGTDWTQDAQPLRAMPLPVRVQQDTPLPAQQVLPGWAPEGPPSRVMPLPVRVQQDTPLPAQQVLPGWAPEGPPSRVMPLPVRVQQDTPLPAQQILPGWAPEGPPSRVMPLPARLAQDTVLPGFVFAALVSWVPDAPAVRTQQAPRRAPADSPLPARVLPALLGWSPEYPSVRAQPAPRRIAQDVPFKGAAAVALSWTPEVPPRRAAPAPARVVQDVPLPAPRVAMPWVPDGAQMFAQPAPRAVRSDPAVFAPLPVAVVLDVVQMRVQAMARRIASDVPLPALLGLLIAWTPDVYYPRSKVPSSYYAGAYVLPGLSAMLRPTSGPQHRTAYGVPRLRIASEKPRNRTAYGAPRNRIAR